MSTYFDLDFTKMSKKAREVRFSTQTLNIDRKRLNLTNTGFDLEIFGLENKDFILRSASPYDNNLCDANGLRLLGRIISLVLS